VYIRNTALSALFKLMIIGFVAYGLVSGLGGSAAGLRYFTIQSNILVGLVTLYLLVELIWFRRPDGTTQRVSAYLRGLTMLSVSVTGIVFNVILAPLIDEPLGFSSVVLHTIVPAGFVLDWLLFARKGSFRFPDIAVWVVPALAYLVITLTVATWDGFYPYPFMDAAEIGYGMVTVNALILLVGFSVLGVVYVAVDKLLARRATASVAAGAGTAAAPRARG